MILWFFIIFSFVWVASHTRSKGDTGIRNEEWWEMLKKVSNIVKSHFFPAQGFRSFWDAFAHKTGWVLFGIALGNGFIGWIPTLHNLK